mgnify:CR=1 FL=1
MTRARKTKTLKTRVSGFTLLEVLLVITLLFFLSLTTFQSVRNTMNAKEDIDYRTEVVQMQRAVFALLERDLRLAFHHVAEDFIWEAPPPDPNNPPDPTQPTPTKPPAITVFRGKGAEIFFSTKSHQRMSADSPENEQHFVTYQIHDNALVRAESKRAIAVADREDAERLKKVVLLNKISKLAFKFYDPKGERWTDEWDTESADTRDVLPMAVEVEMEYTPDVEETSRRKPEPVVFKTSFILTEPLFRKPGAGVPPRAGQGQGQGQGGQPGQGGGQGGAGGGGQGQGQGQGQWQGGQGQGQGGRSQGGNPGGGTTR